jgi:hypothetical protein
MAGATLVPSGASATAPTASVIALSHCTYPAEEYTTRPMGDAGTS